jgi:hypothetical protein
LCQRQEFFVVGTKLLIFHYTVSAAYADIPEITGQKEFCDIASKLIRNQAGNMISGAFVALSVDNNDLHGACSPYLFYFYYIRFVPVLCFRQRSALSTNSLQ